MGFPINQFIEKPDNKLICFDCNDVFDDPWKVCTVDSHITCLDCYEKRPTMFIQHQKYNVFTATMETTSTKTEIGCLRCGNEEVKSCFTPQKALRLQIDQLTMKCRFASVGCSWRGKPRNLMPHEDRCQKSVISCKNKDAGCDFQGVMADVVHHRSHSCPLQKIGCYRSLDPRTGSARCVFLRKNKVDHDSVCKWFECSYCHVTGSLAALELHYEPCMEVRRKELEIEELMSEASEFKKEKDELDEHQEYLYEEIEELEDSLWEQDMENKSLKSENKSLKSQLERVEKKIKRWKKGSSGGTIGLLVRMESRLAKAELLAKKRGRKIKFLELGTGAGGGRERELQGGDGTGSQEERQYQVQGQGQQCGEDEEGWVKMDEDPPAPNALCSGAQHVPDRYSSIEL
ncbi:hypothetical protein T439DRAFT_183101 [Meredithblackwellia eburnea MCA 4105]